MGKFIPYEKLSKKEQQKINKAKRGTWGDINPVTRKPQHSKAYNRKRAQDWKRELPNLRSYNLLTSDQRSAIHHSIKKNISPPYKRQNCQMHGGLCF